MRGIEIVQYDWEMIQSRANMALLSVEFAR
jgi:hypothetical protein